MLSRRELMGAGLAAAGGHGEEQSSAIDPRRVVEITQHLQAIAAELRLANDGCSTGACQVVGRLRDAMTSFLRANGKFPDVVEVGAAVFFAVHDWHVRNRLAPAMARGADGRYALGFMFTRLLLRSDAEPDFFGVPYDVRA